MEGRKRAKELLKKKPEDLRNTPKEEIHSGYKNIIKHMLMDFYMDCSQVSQNFKTLDDLTDFIDDWTEKHNKPPHEDWMPGDKGK